MRQDIIERTDGIPLFVEEMTKAVLEAGSEGAAQRTVASIPSAAMAVPASLQASLMARLDRLGSAKEVAQIGAAIGREFSHDLLAAVVGKPDAELGIGARPSHCCRFAIPTGCTALCKLPIQACAGARCGLWHACCANLVAQCTLALPKCWKVNSLSIADNQPELLARHCTEAGLIEKAATFGAKRVSGRWSVRRWSKPQNSSRAHLIRLRPCPVLRRCVANRLSFRSR